MFVIIDIDGTVADNAHRAHFVEGPGEKDWANFLRPDLVAKDTVIPGAKRGLEKIKALNYGIAFLTGRNEDLRDTTMTWLHHKLGVTELTDDRLFMRPAGNLLKATEYKREQILRIKQDFGSSLLFIDDDRYMWPIYEEFGVVLKAPDCWDTFFPQAPELEPESNWRR